MITCVNEALNSDRDKLCATKSKLISDVDRYKNHIMVLTQQTEKLTNELQRIIDEDAGLYNLNNEQIQRLQKIIYNNKKLLSEEFAALNALENYVRGQSVGNSNLTKTVTQNRATYTIKNQY